jgi:hypothetical protein
VIHEWESGLPVSPVTRVGFGETRVVWDDLPGVLLQELLLDAEPKWCTSDPLEEMAAMLCLQAGGDFSGARDMDSRLQSPFA